MLKFFYVLDLPSQYVRAPLSVLSLCSLSGSLDSRDACRRGAALRVAGDDGVEGQQWEAGQGCQDEGKTPAAVAAQSGRGGL